MIDSNGYKEIDDAANEFVKASKAGDWSKAVAISNQIEFLMQKLTYGVDRYNVIKKTKPNFRPSKQAFREFYNNSVPY